MDNKELDDKKDFIDGVITDDGFLKYGLSGSSVAVAGLSIGGSSVAGSSGLSLTKSSGLTLIRSLV